MQALTGTYKGKSCTILKKIQQGGWDSTLNEEGEELKVLQLSGKRKKIVSIILEGKLIGEEFNVHFDIEDPLTVFKKRHEKKVSEKNPVRKQHGNESYVNFNIKNKFLVQTNECKTFVLAKKTQKIRLALSQNAGILVETGLDCLI